MQTPKLLIVVEELAPALRALDAVLTSPYASAADIPQAAPYPDLDSACLGLARGVNAVARAYAELGEITSSDIAGLAGFDLRPATSAVTRAAHDLATTYQRIARQALHVGWNSRPHAHLDQAARDNVITVAHVLASTIEQCLVVFGLAASGFNAHREVNGSFHFPDNAAELPTFVPKRLTYDHPATLRALSMALDCRNAPAQRPPEAPRVADAWPVERPKKPSALGYVGAAVIGLLVGDWLFGSDDNCL